MAISVLWFRRDLRIADNPALMEAVDAAARDGDGGTVVPVFVFDPKLWDPAGLPRRSYLCDSLRALADSIGGLVIRTGDPVLEIAQLVDEVGAGTVHIAADFGPYGARRDEQVAAELATRKVGLVRTGSPYAVAPGRVLTKQRGRYQVFTPYSKAWREHGWRQPPTGPSDVNWQASPRSDELPEVALPNGIRLPEAGENAARRHWQEFVDERLSSYAAERDRPDLDSTSRMSVHLKWGEIHPRTMLADLDGAGRSKAVERYRLELSWREFYADVLANRPDSAREYYRPEFASMRYSEPSDAFDAWCEGRTGFPIVDAGMRQLRAEGWMHNRVRMIVASFLVKDLHIEWQHGARHFMRWLVDGDLASNQHGWQWTAGCGTDAAPYFRVFNPIEQGKKFDPSGDYIRRYVEELRGVAAPQIHEPRDPIVDHAAERREALDRYGEVKR